TRSGRNTTLSPFHGSDSGFKCLHGRVGKTGVDITGLFTAKTGSRLGGAAIDKAGGREECIAVYELPGTKLPCPHGQGINRHAFQVRFGNPNVFVSAERHGSLLA